MPYFERFLLHLIFPLELILMGTIGILLLLISLMLLLFLMNELTMEEFLMNIVLMEHSLNQPHPIIERFGSVQIMLLQI